MTCHVTGTWRNSAGAVMSDQIMRLTPRPAITRSQPGYVMSPVTIAIHADAAGYIEVNLAPGAYSAIDTAANSVSVMIVPEAASALLENCFEAGAGELTPASVAASQEAAAAAQAAEAAAEAAVVAAQAVVDGISLDVAAAAFQATKNFATGAGYKVPLIGGSLGEVWRMLFTRAGDVLAADSRNGARATAIGGARYVVPQIGAFTAAVFGLAGAVVSGDTIDGKFPNKVHTVPLIGNLTSASFGRDDGMVAGYTIKGDIRSRGFSIPAIGDASSGLWDADSNAVTVYPTNVDHVVDLSASLFQVPQISDLGYAVFSGQGDVVQIITRTEDLAIIGTVEQRDKPGVFSGKNIPQIYLRRADWAFTAVTAGPWAAELVSASTGAAVIRRRGRIDAVRWRTTPVGNGAGLHLILMVGQSLATGHVDYGPFDRYPSFIDPVDERALQFKPGDGVRRGPRPNQITPIYDNYSVVTADAQLVALEPMAGAAWGYTASEAQTAVETTTAALLGQHLHHREVVLGAVVGTGGTGIAYFAAGSAHMASVDKIIVRAQAIAATMLRNLKVWLMWSQGEADNTIGTPRATYVANLTAIKNYISDAAITAGGTFGGLVIQQCDSRKNSGGAAGMATLAQADMIIAGTAIGVPTFPNMPGHSGLNHLYPLTYLPLGSACAWAIAETINGGYATPRVSTATLVDPTTIDLTFSGGNGAFQFDTTTIPDDAARAKGIRVIDDGGDKVISSLTWTSATVLRLVIATSTALGSHPLVNLGIPASGTALLPDPDGPRVNIRDTSSWPCIFTGQPISGWVLIHSVTVT